MPINLTVNDGSFVKYIKFNSKAGRFYVKDDRTDQDVEVEKPRLAFDMDNIRTGWFLFSEGAGPQKVFDSDSQTQAQKPGDNFKRGFEVLVYGADPIPALGGQTLKVREFCSTANVVIGSILSMYDTFEEKAVDSPGQVPIFAYTGSKPITGKHGTNFEPVFQLTGWVDRAKIPELDEVLYGTTTAPEQSTRPAPSEPPPSPPIEAYDDEEMPF